MSYSKKEVEKLIKLFADECETNMELCDYYGRDENGDKIWEGTDLEDWLKTMLEPDSTDGMTDWRETQN